MRAWSVMSDDRWSENYNIISIMRKNLIRIFTL
jgi:hypothetical protein